MAQNLSEPQRVEWAQINSTLHPRDWQLDAKLAANDLAKLNFLDLSARKSSAGALRPTSDSAAFTFRQLSAAVRSTVSTVN